MGWKAVKDHYKINHHVVIENGNLLIGSSFISDIISVSLSQFMVTTTFKIPKELRSFIDNYDTNEFKAVFGEKDHFSKSIPVWAFDGKEIVEMECEELGWPNVTHCGSMMYENTHFKSKEEAIEHAISDTEAGIRMSRRQITRLEEDLISERSSLESEESMLSKLKALTED